MLPYLQISAGGFVRFLAVHACFLTYYNNHNIQGDGDVIAAINESINNADLLYLYNFWRYFTRPRLSIILLKISANTDV